MIATRQRRILEALVQARSLLRDGPGNPHHDAEGKFTSAGGEGHGKHHARRQRRKARRKKRVQAVHKEYKAAAADLKASHRKERAEHVRTERKDRTEKRREHAKERKATAREHAREAASQGRRHGRERVRWEKKWSKARARVEAGHTTKSARLDRAEKQGKDVAGLRERLGKQTAARLQRIEGGPKRLAQHQGRQAKGLRRQQARERKEQRGEQLDEMKSLREDHAADRVSIKERHKEERQDLVERYEADIEEHGYRRKRKKAQVSEGRSIDETCGHRIDAAHSSARTGGLRQGQEGCSGDPIEHGKGQVDVVLPKVQRQFPGRTHKASSAEAILRHVLRRRGWTAAFRRGELTDRQHRTLLEDVRQYAREWMRHEAEVLFASYGREADDDSPGLHVGLRSRGGVDHDLLAVGRALSETLAHHVGRWFGRAKQFVREAILAGVMAIFGDEPLTKEDLDAIDAEADRQDGFLDRFLLDAHYRTPAEIGEGQPALKPMSAPQFIARAEQYGDAPWAGAQQATRKRMVRGREYGEERRLHGRLIDDMCTTCREQVALGWQPIGTLLPIGDSECVGNCHCYFQYRDAEGNTATTVRGAKKKRKKAAPQPPPIQPPAIPPESAEPEFTFDVNVVIGKGPG